MHVFAPCLGDAVAVMATREAEVETVVLEQLQELLYGEFGTWNEEGGREGGRKGGRQEGREAGREGGREREREGEGRRHNSN